MVERVSRNDNLSEILKSPKVKVRVDCSTNSLRFIPYNAQYFTVEIGPV